MAQPSLSLLFWEEGRQSLEKAHSCTQKTRHCEKHFWNTLYDSFRETLKIVPL